MAETTPAPANNWLKRLFWISDERRLAMLWRLIILAILTFIFLVLANIISSIVIVLVLAATGRIDLQAITYQTANVILEEYPILNTATSLASLFGTLLLAVVGSLFPDRRTIRDYGLRLRSRDWWLDLGFGLLLGAFLMALIFAIEMTAGWVSIEDTLVFPSTLTGFAPAILMAVLTFLCVGIYEEMLFRGVLFKGMAEGLGNIRFLGHKGGIIATLVITSVVFGVGHAGNPNATLVSTFNIFLGGIFLGMGYILTGELAIPIGIHITWNFFQGNVFGFPVSGTAANQTTFLGIAQSGSDLWTGGAFGPEAGLIGIVAMMVGTLAIVGYVRLRYGQTGLAEKVAVPELRWQKKSMEVAAEAETLE
ncbi:MAG: CPBP family intramembrane metalloprotease [Anaerolineae bacterium]|nr:CPBP family intramembrane metalloprotease [Anaerolineae bacterium]